MSEYHGYWFYGLRNDEIIQAKDLAEEYCLLNCPQEYDGPFTYEAQVIRYRLANPTLSRDFNQMLKDMEKFYYGECN